MKILWLIIFGVSLVSTAQAASTSPSSKAFDEFQNRCVAQVVNGDANALDGLAKLPTREKRGLLSITGGNPDANDLQIRFTSSKHFFIITSDQMSNFCQMVGLQVNFSDFRSTFLSWREKFGDGYRSGGDFELRSMKPLSLNKQVAGIFMAKALEDGGVLQIHISYHPDSLDGFASIILVRLPVMSPAAKELFANQQP